MKSKIFLLSVSCILFFSCGGTDDIIPDDPIGNSKTVITGDISTTLEYEASFIHTILTSDDGHSQIFLALGNFGTTETALTFSVIQDGNQTGIALGTYDYTADPDAITIFSSFYGVGNNGYSINSNAGAVNRLVLKTITDKKITGEFELNLEADDDGAKIKMVGTFEAIGETAKI